MDGGLVQTRPQPGLSVAYNGPTPAGQFRGFVFGAAVVLPPPSCLVHDRVLWSNDIVEIENVRDRDGLVGETAVMRELFRGRINIVRSSSWLALYGRSPRDCFQCPFAICTY